MLHFIFTSGFHYILKETPIMFACSSCFIETRNNGHLHLNTQGRLHQQLRKDPVKRLVELLPISESWSQAISMMSRRVQG